MGLGIVAYSNLTPVTEDEAVQCNDEDLVPAQAHPDFERTTRGSAPYYRITDTTVTWTWRAGSYSGYNGFRNMLASLAGVSITDVWKLPNLYWEVPFFELLNFSDCEGTVGTEAAKDLLVDFIQHRPQFVAMVASDDPYWISLYDNWIHGLTLASENGVLYFC